MIVRRPGIRLARRIRALAAIAAVAGMAGVQGADGQSHGPTPAPACADSVARSLGGLVGRWTLRAVFRDGADWDTTRAEVIIAPDLDGCVLRERLAATRFGAPYHALSLWGAHGLEGEVQRTSVHSQHGHLSILAGRREGRGLVLRDSARVRGQTVHFEHRFEPFIADSMRFTSRRSTDGGRNWNVTWFADYRRRDD